jgi:flavin-binding protein dodecin
MKEKKKKKSRNEVSSVESETGTATAPGSVARVTEIIASSPNSFEDAVAVGVSRACKTLQNVTGAWVQDQKVDISEGRITAFRVNLKVTFILND